MTSISSNRSYHSSNQLQSFIPTTMAHPRPTSLALLIGAGPTSGAGIARQLATPVSQGGGGMAVALLARNAERLSSLASSLKASVPGAVVASFPTDTSPANLKRAFEDIKAHKDFEGCRLRLGIYHVKNSSKQPFLETKAEDYEAAFSEYNTGAFVFAQEILKRMYDEAGGMKPLEETGGEKVGTIIFTGTLGALRSNAQFASYGGNRAAARSLAQAIAKEHSQYGVHVVHAIANGSIIDTDNEEHEGAKEATEKGRKMSAKAVADTYLWLARQESTLWTHELDLRPAQEKF